MAIVLVTAGTATVAQAQRFFPDGIVLSNEYVRQQGMLDLAAWSEGAVTGETVRGLGVSVGQLSGVNPETGEAIADPNNLLPLVARSLSVAGTISGDASGLTNFPVASTTNSGRVFVDAGAGNDLTGAIQLPDKPFKTIQAAITAASAVASDTHRYVVMVSPGNYTGNVSMANYVSVRGYDIESTVIRGTVTWPPTFTDITGTELGVIGVIQTDAPALIMNAGVDEAYMGVRSCWIATTWTDNSAVKPVVQHNRGFTEIYATTYMEQNIVPTGGVGSIRQATFYYIARDPANSGLTRLVALANTHVMTVRDANDDVTILYTSTANAGTITMIKDGYIRLNLNATNVAYANDISSFYHYQSRAHSFIDNNQISITLATNNSCDVYMGYVYNSVSPGSICTIANCNFAIRNVKANRSWYGAATSSNDTLSIVNSMISSFAGTPGRDVTYGSNGTYTVIAPHAGGNLLLSGSLTASNLMVGGEIVWAAGNERLVRSTTNLFWCATGNTGLVSVIWNTPLP